MRLNGGTQAALKRALAAGRKRRRSVSHQAWEVADQMQLLLGPDTTVVTAQNGISWWYFYGFEGQFANLQFQSVDPDGRRRNALGPERALGCTVYPARRPLRLG